MSDDYLWDRRGADPEVARLEALLGGLAHDAPLAPLPERPRRRAWWIGGAAVALAAAAAIALVVTRGAGSSANGCAGGAGFAFRADGETRCQGAVAARGVLPVGGWLETAPGATAAVTIADIGALTLAGDSRLGLTATGSGEHRLALTRGTLTAEVVAPPRLFVIDTPGATAVDLGCAYELAVLPDGRTRLTVTGGVVELGAHGRTAFVTVGHTVTTAPGRGPGTPVAFDAAPALKAAVERVDRGEAGALAEVVAAAGPGDTLTLWNLLANAAPAERPAILATLDELFPRPEWILADDVVAGRPEVIAALRDVLTSGVWLAPDALPPPPPPSAPPSAPPPAGTWR